MPEVILARLMFLYGRPLIPKIEQALRQLNDPMDLKVSIEVMLRGVEEV